MTQKDKSIEISPKYGLNVSLDHCFVCNKETNLVLHGRIREKGKRNSDVEAPRKVCTGGLCDECQKVIDNGGAFFLEVEDESTPPKRTGRAVALEKLWAVKSFDQEIKDIQYIEKTLFNKLFKKQDPHEG